MCRLIANITPLCGRVLSNTAIQRWCKPLKRFLQSHIGGEIYFSASIQDPFSPWWNSPIRYQLVDYKFTMLFHLSYVALRPGPTKSDPRGLRQTYSMIKPIDNDFDDLHYYDAQTSFFLTGTSDRQWTAYCLVDTFFWRRTECGGLYASSTRWAQRRRKRPNGAVLGSPRILLVSAFAKVSAGLPRMGQLLRCTDGSTRRICK